MRALARKIYDINVVLHYDNQSKTEKDLWESENTKGHFLPYRKWSLDETCFLSLQSSLLTFTLS